MIKSNWKSSSLFCLLFPLASCCRTLPWDKWKNVLPVCIRDLTGSISAPIRFVSWGNCWIRCVPKSIFRLGKIFYVCIVRFYVCSFELQFLMPYEDSDNPNSIFYVFGVYYRFIVQRWILLLFFDWVLWYLFGTGSIIAFPTSKRCTKWGGAVTKRNNRLIIITKFHANTADIPALGLTPFVQRQTSSLLHSRPQSDAAWRIQQALWRAVCGNTWFCGSSVITLFDKKHGETMIDKNLPEWNHPFWKMHGKYWNSWTCSPILRHLPVKHSRLLSQLEPGRQSEPWSRVGTNSTRATNQPNWTPNQSLTKPSLIRSDPLSLQS